MSPDDRERHFHTATIAHFKEEDEALLLILDKEIERVSKEAARDKREKWWERNGVRARFEAAVREYESGHVHEVVDNGETWICFSPTEGEACSYLFPTIAKVRFVSLCPMCREMTFR